MLCVTCTDRVASPLRHVHGRWPRVVFESALRVGRGLDGPCDRIYFLTDGEPSDGDPTSVALDVSRQLRAPVHTIVRAVVLTSRSSRV